MERNFTDERKSEVRDIIEANLFRWIQLELQVESNSEFVSELGLNAVSDFSQNYRDRVVEKLQKGLEILEEKYKDANDIDKSYASNHVADAIKSIQSLNTYILRLAESLHPENGGMDAGKASSLNAMWNSYELMFANIQQKREFAYDVENIVYDVHGVRKKIDNVGIVSQKYVVEAYELLHPEIKEKMEHLLNTGQPNILTAEDITSIKYIVYTASEPYRTVYLEHIDKYEFACIYNNEDEYKSFYSYNINTISLQNANAVLSKDKRGPYTTLLHECGHATDYIFNENDEGYFCVEYQSNSDSLHLVKEATGKEYVTLQDAIYYDVYNNITEKIREWGITDETRINSILDTFKYGGDVEELTGIDKYVRDEILKEYKLELVGENNNAAGDVYGGVTNLVISGDGIYGHFPSDGNIDSYRYWYYKDGKATQNQGIELWAHYFACNLTGDKEAQESIRQYFPEASKILDEMVIYMREESYVQ